MKILKAAFRISLFANIVLILWALSQRRTIQEFESFAEGHITFLDTAIATAKEVREGIHEMNESLKDQILQTVASIDQMDAFIEEHTQNDD